MRKRRGFSLIELMVVVAIIVILAIAGMAIYSGIQDTAKKGACQANMRAIKTAVQSILSGESNQIRSGATSTFLGLSLPPDADNNGRWDGWNPPTTPAYNVSGGTIDINDLGAKIGSEDVRAYACPSFKTANNYQIDYDNGTPTRNSVRCVGHNFTL